MTLTLILPTIDYIRVLRFVAASVPVPALSTPSRPGSRYTLNRFSPQALSESLCRRAKSVYEDQRAVTSPFQQRAMEEGIHFAGGKRDDITTLIGIVGELEASPVCYPPFPLPRFFRLTMISPLRIVDETLFLFFVIISFSAFNRCLS